MDRISNLPDEILCQILSFFPTTKEAASTSHLSKRWRNLFAFSPNLSFEQREKIPKAKEEYIATSSLVDFVDRVLAVSGNSTIRKFSLNIKRSGISPHINRWMINVLSRGIVGLRLENYPRNVVITLPLEIFTCKTLVNLKLVKLRINMVPENASLPALKTLFLDCVLFSGCAFEALISACHVLEELTLSARLLDAMYGQNVSSYPTVVSCPTLKWLSITCGVSIFDDFRSIIIDTPRLTSLVFDDFVVDEYGVVNLDSLVEAQISLWKRSNRKRNPEKLIKGLRNVKILNLFSKRTSEVLYSYADSVPLFKNLTRLSIEIVFPSVRWKLIPLLLKKSPNLETLVIQGPKIYKDKYNYGEESQSLIRECLSECTALSSCLVKVLGITRYRGTKGELEQMKYFVVKLPCLELVNVHANFDAEVTLTADMLMLPKDSKIQLKFFPYKTHE